MTDKKKYRIELYRSQNKGKPYLLDAFWFRIVHKNGNIICTSETYTTSQARNDSANNLGETCSLAVVDCAKEESWYRSKD